MMKIKSATAYAVIALAGLGVGYVAPRLPQWLHKTHIDGDYSSYLQESQTRVIVYGTESCTFCKRAQAYLASRHIPYAFADVERSPSAAKAHASLGVDGVPVVIIGDRLVQGFRPDEYADALKRLN